MARNHTAEYKAKIALELLREEHTASEIGAREGVTPSLLNTWRRELEKSAYRAFSVTKDEKTAQELASEAQAREEGLMSTIGRLSVENAWLKKKAEQLGTGGKASGR
jgi:putative transposase